MNKQHLFNFLGTLYLSMAILMTSCKTDDDVIVSNEITEEDAVEVVENAVAQESGGLTEQIETTIVIADFADPEQNPMCGLSFDSTLLQTNQSGSVILYNYEYQWTWNVQCDILQTPEQFDFYYEMDGWCNAPRLESLDYGFNDFSISGLNSASEVYVYSGLYQRYGNIGFKTGFQTTIDSELTIEISEIIISKTTGEILEGSGSVSFIGKSSNGQSVTFEGTITFEGGDTATLKFENEFIISL